jgi:hypothetical protein
MTSLGPAGPIQLNSEPTVPSAHPQATEAQSSGESTTDQTASHPGWPGFVADDSENAASVPSGSVLLGTVAEEQNGATEQPGAIDAAPSIPEVPADMELPASGLLDAVLPIDVSGLSAAVIDVLSRLNAVYTEMEPILPETEYAIALLGVAVGLTAYEVGRRRRRALTALVALPSTLALEPT